MTYFFLLLLSIWASLSDFGNTTADFTENAIQGPVVWTDPPFPTVLDDITLYFDASEGNGALANYEGAIYAHMGLITSESTTGTDWRYVIGNWGTDDLRTKMTRDTGTIYRLSYNIKEHHNIPEGVDVLQLAFVFRNESGSIVGRDADGSDIFLDVYSLDEGLQMDILEPSAGSIYELGDSLNIQLITSDTAQIDIIQNGDTIYNGLTDMASTSLLLDRIGRQEFEFRAATSNEIVKTYLYPLVIDSIQPIQEQPSEIQNGLNYYSDSTYIFQLSAPGKEHCFLLTYENKWVPELDYQMNVDSSQEVFWIELSKSIFDGRQHGYQYLVDGELRIADPFSTVVLDPAFDYEIRNEVMDELPEYPVNLTTGVITAFDIEPDSISIIPFVKPAKKELNIYEILLRDFLEDHSFPTLMDTLGYLEKLGINAIELMPVNEFEGNQSWGYNPAYHMAVDKYYGSRTELKEFIQEAHRRGIAVILDVVFNHAFSQSPLVQLYWDAANFRPAADNPWLNVTARHPFNVGYDFNHEYEGTRNWVKQILSYWLNEFQVDGFRFDLSKGFTQFDSGNNIELSSQYDQSRIDILKDYSDHIWSIDSTAYVLMEHFAVNSEETELANYGMMLWDNMNHTYTQLAQGYGQDLARADFREREWSEPHSLSFMESHDEERMVYNILLGGDREGSYSTRRLPTALERVAAAGTIYFTIPGPKMIWQFGELGFDFSINRCVNGVVDGCRLDPKPIRWDYIYQEDRSELLDVISDLLYLRNNYPVFTSLNFELDDRFAFTKSVKLFHEEMDAMSLANFRVTESNVIPYFPYTGIWYEYFSGDSLLVSNLDDRILLEPGGYRIYTSKKIARPGGFTTSRRTYDQTEMKIYPNPINGSQFTIELSEPIDLTYSELIDLQGRKIPHQLQGHGTHWTLQFDKELAAGTYIIKCFGRDKSTLAKVVKN